MGRLPCPSLSPRVCSNSCPLSQWCHPTISSSVTPLLLLPLIFPSIRLFSNESVLCIRWPKYWNFSFSISASNEYSGLISFRIDWFELLVVQVSRVLFITTVQKHQFFGALGYQIYTINPRLSLKFQAIYPTVYFTSIMFSCFRDTQAQQILKTWSSSWSSI